MSILYTTQKGEQVKSAFEKAIADFLFIQKIEYQYEKSIRIGRAQRKMYRPDFYLPRYDLYIEYYGLLGDKEYNTNIFLKKHTQHCLGLNVMELYPNNWDNLSWVIRARFKERTGKTFPQRAFIPRTKKPTLFQVPLPLES